MFTRRGFSALTAIIIIAFSSNIFQESGTTEITELSSTYDGSLGYQIALPVLACNVKHSGYTKISWFKDFVLIRSGAASLENHVLPVEALLDNSSSDFTHPFKLQGYYWCETDDGTPTPPLKFLFRVKGVHTFVGSLLATKDSLGEDDELSLQEKIAVKTQIYESEMQEILFGFLRPPNTYVTRIKPFSGGLEVRFILYVQQNYLPRAPYANELVQDQHQLEYVEDYLNNETITDEEHYNNVLDWLTLRGIRLEDIKLLSTVGCYTEAKLIPAEPPREVTWPYAEIGEIVIPEESCSSLSGRAVTRICLGSFLSGAYWSKESAQCDLPPPQLTMKLKQHYENFGNEKKYDYIKNLQNLTQQAMTLSVTDVHIVLNTLKQLSSAKDITDQDISNMFSIVDDFLKPNKTDIEVEKRILRLTNRILEIIDNIVLLARTKSKEILISKRHLLIDTKNTKIDDNKHVVGVAIMSPNLTPTIENSSVEFLFNGTEFPYHNSLAYFLLPPELVLKRETELVSPSQVSMAYFEELQLFPTPMNLLPRRDSKILPSNVMHVSLSGGSAWNLTEPVQLFFRDMLHVEMENPICAYYDPRFNNDDGGWSNEGCSYAGLKNRFHVCQCQHLSTFAIILYQRQGQNTAKFKMHTSLYISCGFSILALSFAVLLYFLSKVWRSTPDHDVLFWLIFSFFCCLVLLFTSEMHFQWKPGCRMLAFIFHYLVLVTFCWLLVLAVMYQVRFAKKTDVAEIPWFVLRCCVFAWCTPVFIMAIVWISKKYKYHEQPTCWPSVVEVERAAFIPAVMILFITLCVNISAVYAMTCRFKKDFLIAENKFTDGVVKFRVQFSIYFLFVLTWIFGFLSLNYKSDQLQILFGICTIVVSYYVALFFVFHEISLWSLLSKLRKKEPSTEVLKYDNKAYQAEDNVEK